MEHKQTMRAPHRATAEVVKRVGDPAAQTLYKLFREYNKRFFSGKLAPALILITQSKSARTHGDYIARDIHGLESRIRIAPATVARGMTFAADVLLHEMVHAWFAEVDGDQELGWRGHGPKFAEKANEIGAKLGLPRVSAKGRVAGEPDCAQWPQNVRPTDYYGDMVKAPVAKRRATVERDEEHERDEDGEETEHATEQRHAAMIAHVIDQLPELSDGSLYALANAIATEVRKRAQAGAGASALPS